MINIFGYGSILIKYYNKSNYNTGKNNQKIYITLCMIRIFRNYSMYKFQWNNETDRNQ